MAEDVKYQVTGPAAFAIRQSGPGQLVYRGAPLPTDTVNLESLLDSGLVEKVEDPEQVSAHPSDLPPDLPPEAAVVADVEEDAAKERSVTRGRRTN